MIPVRPLVRFDADRELLRLDSGLALKTVFQVLLPCIPDLIRFSTQPVLRPECLSDLTYQCLVKRL